MKAVSNCFCSQGAPGKDGDVGAPGPSGISVCIPSFKLNLDKKKVIVCMFLTIGFASFYSGTCWREGRAGPQRTPRIPGRFEHFSIPSADFKSMLHL